MEPQRELAIVLRTVPFEDRHRIVTALTENHGVVSALARNCVQSRRFGGALDLFTASEWQYAERPGAELWSLREATVRRSFEGLRKDFEKLSLASVFSEILLRVGPHNEAAPDLFRLHSNALAALEDSQEPVLPLLNAYMAKLLQWNGTQPRLHECGACQRPLNDFLEMASPPPLSCVIAESAGWVCEACRVGAAHQLRVPSESGFQTAFLRVTAKAVRDFQFAFVSPIRQAAMIAQAGREEHLELFRFLEALFAFHVPGFDKKPLNGLRFLALESNLKPPAANPQQNRHLPI